MPGRFGRPVLGFGVLCRPIAYIHVGVPRHFPRPVGRIRQYDGGFLSKHRHVSFTILVDYFYIYRQFGADCVTPLIKNK